MSAGRKGLPGGGFEAAGATESPQDRVEYVQDAMQRIVKDYLNNDPRLIEIAERIVKDGGEGLHLMSAGDEEALRRRPEILGGLEAIVRTDGSRPSFLIRNGEIDRASSPLGGWAGLLEDSAGRLRDAIACVGRIDIPGSSVGFMGTGFLIQENLIVTNRHVLQVSARQYNGTWKFSDGAAIDFGHEFRGRDSVNRRKLKRVVFCGNKAINFDSIDHSKLDLALIELESASASRTIKVLPLNLSPTWAAVGKRIVTIGYPGSPPFMLYPPTLLEQLFQSTYGYKRIAPGELIASQTGVLPWTLTHDATTLGGNSGSVVLLAGNEQVSAGLHYGGRGVEPRENWGHVLADVLNEPNGQSNKTLRDVLRENGVQVECSGPPATGTTTPAVSQSPRPRPAAQPTKTGDWRQGVTLAMMRPLSAVPGKSRLEAAQLEAAGDGHTPAAQFANREGYSPDFIEDFTIPLPIPSADVRTLRRGGTGVELKYEHFSVIMSASRKMPMITACNIDGAESRSLPRIQQWSYDGRLNDEDQWGNELYQNNDLDRGHMVRREDPVWGSLAVAGGRMSIRSITRTVARKWPV
jgi:V8-like Glu-specific endopeptidase